MSKLSFTTKAPYPPPVVRDEKLLNIVTPKHREKMIRIVAPVPVSLKQDMKRYILDHPGETEKSLILKGLRTLGFSIEDEYIEDQRKNNK